MVTKQDLLKKNFTEPIENVFKDQKGKHFVILGGEIKSVALLGLEQVRKLGIDEVALAEIIRKEHESNGQKTLDQTQAQVAPGPKECKAEIVPVERPYIEVDEAPILVAPVVSVEKVVEAFENFQRIKKAILTEDDFTRIGTNKILNKSGTRKLRVPFNLSIEILKEEKVPLVFGDYEWRVTIRTRAPNGVYVDSVGSCNTLEDFAVRQKRGMAKRLNLDIGDVVPEAVNHFIRSMASTRAESRGIMTIVGGSGGLDEEEEEKADK